MTILWEQWIITKNVLRDTYYNIHYVYNIDVLNKTY